MGARCIDHSPTALSVVAGGARAASPWRGAVQLSLFDWRLVRRSEATPIRASACAGAATELRYLDRHRGGRRGWEKRRLKGSRTRSACGWARSSANTRFDLDIEEGASKPGSHMASEAREAPDAGVRSRQAGPRQAPTTVCRYRERVASIILRLRYRSSREARRRAASASAGARSSVCRIGRTPPRPLRCAASRRPGSVCV